MGNINPDNYDLFGGDSNVPLTILGEAQARHAGMALRQYLDAHPEFQHKTFHVISSPYRRTQQTKEAILQGLKGIPIESDEEDKRIREQNMGIERYFRNVEPEKIDPRYAQYYPVYQQYLSDKAKADTAKLNAKPPLGESLAEVAARTGPFIEEIKQSYGENDVVIVVGHGQSNRIAMAQLLGRNNLLHDKMTGNCVVTILNESPDHTFHSQIVHAAKQLTKRDFAHIPFDPDFAANVRGLLPAAPAR